MHFVTVPSVRRKSQTGFSLVWVLLVLAMLAMVALALAPTVPVEARKIALDEDQMVAQLSEGFREYVARYQVIPGVATWVQAIAQVTGLSVTSVRQVFPQFSTETGSRRVFLIDPRFRPASGSTLLPFTPPAGGLDPAVATEVPNAFARVMIVSSSKRGLALPFASGVPTAAVFDDLWDWNRTPGTTSTPPPGFGAAWQGRGMHLHVARIDLSSQFDYAWFRGLSYAAKGGGPVSAGAGVARYFLRGTDLTLYAASNGAMLQRHVMRGDVRFDFRHPVQPLGWWSFAQGGSGSVATNTGTLGPTADAVPAGAVTVAPHTLTAPAHPGYPATNYSAVLDGTTASYTVPHGLLNGLQEFTLACWVNPSSLPMAGAAGLCGQRGVVEFGFTPGNNLTVNTGKAGQVNVAYPHPVNEWHHLAVTGDGQALCLYVDGLLRASGGTRLVRTDYGSSSDPFRLAGGGIFDLAGNYFHGALDDVGVFDRALTTSQITKLMLGQLP